MRWHDDARHSQRIGERTAEQRPGAAERALSTLPLSHDVCEIGAGIVQVATAVMARALKRVSVARGIDPRGMALLPFGGGAIEMD
jgi:N-methylhydantoinase A